MSRHVAEGLHRRWRRPFLRIVRRVVLALVRRRQVDLEGIPLQFLFVLGVEKDRIALENQLVFVAFFRVGQFVSPARFLQFLRARIPEEAHGPFADGFGLLLSLDVDHLEFGSADTIAFLDRVHEGSALENAFQRLAVVSELIAVGLEHFGVRGEDDLRARGPHGLDPELVGGRGGVGGCRAGLARELDFEQVAFELIAHLGFFFHFELIVHLGFFFQSIDGNEIGQRAGDLRGFKNCFVGFEIVREGTRRLNDDLRAAVLGVGHRVGRRRLGRGLGRLRVFVGGAKQTRLRIDPEIHSNTRTQFDTIDAAYRLVLLFGCGRDRLGARSDKDPPRRRRWSVGLQSRMRTASRYDASVAVIESMPGYQGDIVTLPDVPVLMMRMLLDICCL